MLGKKKIYMSVTATAFIASALFGIDDAEAASTYKVQSGDSLWKIAQKHNISVTQLKSFNNLTNDIIFPNQVLKTEKASSNNQTTTKTVTTTSQVQNKTSPSKATTYTVKPGDSLSAIASKHKISLSDLMKWNNLNTTLIYPGNVFVVSKPTTAETTNNTSNQKTDKPKSSTVQKTEKPQENKVQSALAYTVKSGDTLSRIALEYKVTIANLKKWNNLKSDTIYIGQKLNIGEGAKVVATPKNEAPSKNTSYNVNKLINTAKSQLGVGYAWGGASPYGFDCSGFIYYAYKEAGLNIGRHSSEGYHMRSYYVDTPKVGDLVFFEGTYKTGISHVGIYIGNNEFIHTTSTNGVIITSLDNAYWKKHFEGFKRFY